LDALRGKYKQTEQPATEEAKYQTFAKQIRRQFDKNPNSIKQLCLSQKSELYVQGVKMSDNIKKILKALLIEAKKYSIIPSSHESEYLGETGTPPKEKQQLYGILMHLRDIDVFVEVAKIITPKLYEVMKPILSSRPITTRREKESNIPGWVDKQLSKAYRPNQPMLHFDTGYTGSIPQHMFSEGAPETPVKLISANDPHMQLHWEKDIGFASMLEHQTPHMMFPLTDNNQIIKLEKLGKYGDDILGFYAVVFGAIDGIKNEIDEKTYTKIIDNQRKIACETAKTAYEYAKEVDKKPTNETRTAACKSSWYAYAYALDVDKCPTDETRTAACQNSEYAYEYAKEVDKKPTDETRDAVCNDPYRAYMYAKYVDKGPTDETRTAACQNPEFAYLYAVYIDQRPTDETRTAACKYSKFAYEYAINIDNKPTDETKAAAYKHPYYAKRYDEAFKTLC
jgi:hypothetical protein